jgi:hypothetical protein
MHLRSYFRTQLTCAGAPCAAEPVRAWWQCGPWARTSGRSGASAPRAADERGLNGWLFRTLRRPGVLLVFLCLTALVNYYDRGAFVGILPILQREFSMDDKSAGLIGGAFIGTH